MELDNPHISSPHAGPPPRCSPSKSEILHARPGYVDRPLGLVGMWAAADSRNGFRDSFDRQLR